MIWRGDYLVAPLREIMDKPFEETVTVLRVNNLALPTSGISFPLRLRHDCMLEGLWPLPDLPSDPEKRGAADAAQITELLNETHGESVVRAREEAEESPRSSSEAST